jgi:hypothetical protein
MIIAYDQPWVDPNSSWQVKLYRAGEHIGSLRGLLREYRGRNPVIVKAEPTDDPDVLAYRVHYREPVPTPIYAIIGDALHNLRTALESVAFELARVSQAGRTLTAAEEVATTFPICSSPEAFGKWFSDRGRDKLYDERARRALESVQPYAEIELMREAGIERSYEESLRWNELHRLHVVWNIDKHRRVVDLTWRPDLVWWGSSGPSQRVMLHGDGTLAEDSILFRIKGRDDDGSQELNCEFNLTFPDDPAFAGADGAKDDVLAILEGWHGRIGGYVFPRLFTLMSQRPER